MHVSGLKTRVCRILLVVMVFAQITNTAQACMALEITVMAFSKTLHHDHCNKPVNPNSCLQQATSGDQSFSNAETPTFASVDVAVLILPSAFDAPLPSFTDAKPPLHATDPPGLTRFCSLQL